MHDKPKRSTTIPIAVPKGVHEWIVRGLDAVGVDKRIWLEIPEHSRDSIVVHSTLFFVVFVVLLLCRFSCCSMLVVTFCKASPSYIEPKQQLTFCCLDSLDLY